MQRNEIDRRWSKKRKGSKKQPTVFDSNRYLQLKTLPNEGLYLSEILLMSHTRVSIIYEVSKVR